MPRAAAIIGLLIVALLVAAVVALIVRQPDLGDVADRAEPPEATPPAQTEPPPATEREPTAPAPTVRSAPTATEGATEPSPTAAPTASPTATPGALAAPGEPDRRNATPEGPMPASGGGAVGAGLALAAAGYAAGRRIRR